LQWNSKKTAGPSTTRRSVENIPKKGPLNCRSLGYARDDKREGDASIGERLLNESRFSSPWRPMHRLQFLQPLFQMEAPPSPLSSRAQPRDLQFSGPFLEMFFEGLRFL
jgi:hypothetical protein